MVIEHKLGIRKSGFALDGEFVGPVSETGRQEFVDEGVEEVGFVGGVVGDEMWGCVGVGAVIGSSWRVFEGFRR